MGVSNKRGRDLVEARVKIVDSIATVAVTDGAGDLLQVAIAYDDVGAYEGVAGIVAYGAFHGTTRSRVRNRRNCQ
jgi:hypothetical protein